MQQPTDHAELKVLLIEDSATDARLVQALVAEAGGLALTWAASLEAALLLMSRTSFDAVLLDLLLPDSHGIDLIPKVRAAAPSAAIVVTSGQSAQDHLLAQAVIRKGADDLVPKQALSADLLARSLAMAVERARLKAAANRRETALARALAAAGIGHWTWTAGDRTVHLAGSFPGLGEVGALAIQQNARGSIRMLLRRLPRNLRRSLLAARRELGLGTDRLVVAIVEAEPRAGASASELILDIVVARDGEGRIARIDGLVREAPGNDAIEQLEGELITQLGHELRTPLTTIRGALGLLGNAEEARLTPSARILVDKAIANADRLGRVIGEVLLQRAEGRGRFCGQPRRVPLGRFLCDAVAARLPALTAAGLSLGLVPSAHDLDDLVDAGQLRRAVDCLCRRLLVECAGSEPAGMTRFTLDVVAHHRMIWLRAAPAAATARAASWHGATGPARPGHERDMRPAGDRAPQIAVAMAA